jgi:hypothetical protein
MHHPRSAVLKSDHIAHSWPRSGQAYGVLADWTIGARNTRNEISGLHKRSNGVNATIVANFDYVAVM